MSDNVGESRAAAVLLRLSSVCAILVTILIAVGGGISLSLGSLRISARDPYRPFYLAVVLTSIAIWHADRRRLVPSWDRLSRHCGWIAGAAAILTVVLGISYGAFVAGGADAYGYVSQAQLLSTGRLTAAEPLASVAPSLGPSVAPLGYRLAADGATLIPVYPPGLPLLMALSIKVAGFSGVFLVVPLFGGVAVWLTYIVGKRVGDARAALLAALLLACSPIFLLQLMQPMSDVPVTAFWIAALAAALWRPTTGAAFAAGLLVSGALLIRPNLLPLSVAVAVVALATSPRLLRGLAFVAGAIPGAAAIAFVNWKLYGSPLTSGYGANAALFSLGWVTTNLRRYPVWLYEVESPFVFLGLAAPFLSRRDPLGPAFSRRLATCLLLFVVILLACYLVYLPFDSWAFLRFLLPGIPLLLILAGLTALWLISRAPARTRTAIFVAVSALLCSLYIHRASASDVFHDAESQHRFRAVARYVRDSLPRNAVVLTVIQSGSLRLYAQRSTLRWDLIAPESLDDTIATLRRNGFVPYILVEQAEANLFRQRFASSRYGALNWSPVAEYLPYEWVRIWSIPGMESRPGDAASTARIAP